jgi:hypothetical protein
MTDDTCAAFAKHVRSPTRKVWLFPRDLGRYLGLVQRNDAPCEHGHLGCAAWEGGPCMDELLHTYRPEEA